MLLNGERNKPNRTIGKMVKETKMILPLTVTLCAVLHFLHFIDL